MVGVGGFELPTSCSQSRRATGLRYTPVKKRRPFKDRLLRSALLASDLKIRSQYYLVSKMVGRVGFEPTTNWLKANCSTN